MSGSSEFGKQYGLILPKKNSNQSLIQRPSVFNEDSDSENSNHGGGDWRATAFKAGAGKAVEKRHTKIQIQKALSEDPSIYQYDEVYDGMRESINKATPKKDEKKQSRYIQSLKRNAERRKLENERRTERQVQKEREEEGEQFKDKETFVTASYKKKLEEFRKLDEEEKRMDHLEDIGDVTKQKDLSGFYRHLYKSTVNEDLKNTENLQIKRDSDSKAAPHSSGTEQKEDVTPVQNKKRQYRKRARSNSSKEEGEKTSSSSDSESENDQKNKVLKPNTTDGNGTTLDENKASRFIGKENVDNSTKSSEFGKGKENIKLDICVTYNKAESKEEVNKVSVTKSTPLKLDPVINIWAKRTVGSNFDEALQRYLERKSQKKYL